MTLPRLREEIQIDVHEEDGQSFLVLSDTFGIAEGPIMINADLLEVLEACNGETTIEQLAATAEVAVDGPEMLSVQAFVGQLAAMGYMEGPAAEQRARDTISAFVNSDVRMPVCAGSTYAADPDELHKQLDNMLGITSSDHDGSNAGFDGSNAGFEGGKAGFVLAPHIDFRVAPEMYGPCFNAIRNTDADLFVMIGTSHYWAQHTFILTAKNFVTPIGTVHTDVPLVTALRDRLESIDASHPAATHALLAPNDLAHKPEHSIELHAVLLQHLFGERPYTILPILVTSLQQFFHEEGPPAAGGAFHAAIDAIREVVAESGRQAVWLVSGDLAHVGVRFGDQQGARVMMPDVREADSEILRHLASANPNAYYDSVRSIDDKYRICGLAPAYVALHAARPNAGTIVAYDLWDDAETASAVSFAGVVFS